MLVAHFGVLAAALTGSWLDTFKALTVPPFPVPFGDFRVVTAAPLSADQGFDPLVANPQDVQRRALNYPRIWIAIGRQFQGEAGVITAGLILAALFSLPAAWLAATQRTTAASVSILLVGLSASTWLALERGNTDLLIFALVAGALFAPSRFRAPLLGVATILKIYPFITTLVEAIRERTIVGFGIAVATTVYLIAIFNDLIQITKTTEVGGMLSFGVKAAALLFRGSAYAIGDWTVVGVFAVGTLVALVLGLKRPLQAKVPAFEENALLLAGPLLLFCYVTASNWDYRLVFTVLLIPYFLRPAEASERILGWVAVGSILLACNYTLLMYMRDTGILLNAAAKYLLYCILVFSVTRVIVRTDDVQFMIENWRATAKR